MTSLTDSDPRTAVEGAGLWSRSLRTRTLVSFLFAAAVLIFLAGRLEVDFGRIWETIKRADFRIYALGFLVYYATFPMRGLRWRLLLSNANVGGTETVQLPSVRTLAEFIFLGWFANCVIPAKLGDAYRGYQLKRTAHVSFAHSLGTIVAERILDMAVMVLLLLTSLWVLSNTGDRQGEMATSIFKAGVVLLAIGVCGLAGMWLLRDHLHTRLPQPVRAMYLRFQQGTLGSFRSLPWVVLLSLAIWLVEASRLFLVMTALNLPLGFPYALFLSLANSLLTVVPFTPGGLGLVEAGIVGLLILGGVDKETAVATALLDRTITYWSLIVLGFPLFLYRRRV